MNKNHTIIILSILSVTLLMFALYGAMSNSSNLNSAKQQSYLEGYTHGASSIDTQQLMTAANKTNYNQGYIVGYSEGYSNGTANPTKIIEQPADRYNEGYIAGQTSAKTASYNEGYTKGHQDGYSSGYINGTIAGAGSGYNIRDPTYEEMMAFIVADQTDKITYNLTSYNCYDFTNTVCNNAFNYGYRAGYAYIEFQDSAHAIVCFKTVDRGIIFIEPQSDLEVKVTLGLHYWDRTIYETPSYDDTIVRYGIIW